MQRAATLPGQGHKTPWLHCCVPGWIKEHCVIPQGSRMCPFMLGCPVGIGLCSFAKSGAARHPALLCKDTSPSNYYITFQCMSSTSWVSLQCWPSPRSVGRPSSRAALGEMMIPLSRGLACAAVQNGAGLLHSYPAPGSSGRARFF